MSDRTLKLTRRRLLGGLVTVGGASAAAGAGTMALFSDTVSSRGNTIQAGTLDLSIGGNGGTQTFLNETDIVPGQTGSSSINLSNSGTVAGHVQIEIAELTSNENGYDGNENNGQDPGEGGELDDYLEVHWSLGGDTILNRQAASNLSGGQVVEQPGVSISSDATEEFTFEWELLSSAEQVQGDSFSIDLTFRLIQPGGP